MSRQLSLEMVCDEMAQPRRLGAMEAIIHVEHFRTRVLLPNREGGKYYVRLERNNP